MAKKAKPKKPVEESEPLAEIAEATPITLDDITKRVTGIVNNARNAGVTTITRRLFAGLEGFFGGVAGDDEKKPPRKR